MIDAKLICNAIRALGFTPISVPAHIPNGICMFPAKCGERDVPAPLLNLAAQFGLTWELHTLDDNFYGYWILEI